MYAKAGTNACSSVLKYHLNLGHICY